ncbi:MAG: ABC transporter permease [Planctomycetes bacterium]|jgi:lipopolysaccharide transport system permease protein|nr:ABC transporter permease [Planctomycetota bacterium]HNZ67368.1 ABC transporter permease [Planctomycetota bacterium]HON44085.1 ABC transporter permease [Planctomycetota bacterium]HPY74837.1 ABC transporter permease [Planctomycetota bacterium]HQB01541.1 ABC transporter permease [Planctomycetota bacterium]
MHDFFKIHIGFKIFKDNFYLATQIIRRDVEMKYKGSTLGLAWSLAHPLLMLTVYTIVFTKIFKAISEDPTVPYSLFLLSGMATYNIFRETVFSSCMLFINNKNYVKKIIFPLEILPMTKAISCLIFGLFWFILLFFGLIIFTNKLSWNILFFPLILIPLVIFSTGISYFSSSITVYLRDFEHVVSVLLQALFFLTPICYSTRNFTPKMIWYLRLNPMALIVEESRRVFLYGQPPNWKMLGMMFLGSLICFQLGFYWFRLTKKGFANIL